MKFPFLSLIFYLKVIICTCTIERDDNTQLVTREKIIDLKATMNESSHSSEIFFINETLPVTVSDITVEQQPTSTPATTTSIPTTTATSTVTTATSSTSMQTITTALTTPPTISTSTPTTTASTTSPIISTSTPTTTASTTPPIISTSTTTTTTTLSTTTSVPTLKLSDSTPYRPWNPVVDGNFEVIEADMGYKIRVDIVICDLISESGENVQISTSEKFEVEDTLLIAYTTDNFKAFLFNTNLLYASFTGTPASNFTANFTRVGEKLTTVSTEEPTTTIILPTPSANDSYELTVFLGGRNADDYKKKDVQMLLKEIIRDMATEYCKTENFKLTEIITTNNVILEEIVECSVNWPDYTNCVSLTFAVPVDLAEDSTGIWKGYQLTSEHLKIMWDTYAKKYLKEGLYIYSPPDSPTWLKVQLILFSSVTFVFVICLIAIRQISLTISKKMLRRRMSDTTSIISSERPSEDSLPPHYLQETPPLFDNTYMMYNPKNDKAYEPSLSENFGYNYGNPNFSDLSMGVENDEDDDHFDSDTSQIQESGA